MPPGQTLLPSHQSHISQPRSRLSDNLVVENIFFLLRVVIFRAGDALLAVWKVGKDQYLFDILHQVISCGLLIQNTIMGYRTESNMALKGKKKKPTKKRFNSPCEHRGRQHAVHACCLSCTTVQTASTVAPLSYPPMQAK